MPGGMIIVGPDGNRFTDEKLKTRHGKVPVNGTWRPMAVHCPMYMVFDETMRTAAPLYSKNPNRGWTAIIESYDWSDDNSAEVEKGWIKRAGTTEELAKIIGLDPEKLTETVNRWNLLAKAGKDDASKAKADELYARLSSLDLSAALALDGKN